MDRWFCNRMTPQWIFYYTISIEPIIQLSLLCHAVSHRWQLVFRITASLWCHIAHQLGISLKRLAFISQFLSQIIINTYYIPMLIYFCVKKSHYFLNIFIFVYLIFSPRHRLPDDAGASLVLHLCPNGSQHQLQLDLGLQSRPPTGFQCFDCD